MGPNIIYERRASNMSDSTNSMIDRYSGCHKRRTSQEQVSWNLTHHQDSRSGSRAYHSGNGDHQREYGSSGCGYLQESRSDGYLQESTEHSQELKNGNYLQGTSNGGHSQESRDHSYLQDGRNSVNAQEFRNPIYQQEGRNIGSAQESRTTDSPLYQQHVERLPAEQEKQKFLVNNQLEWTDCHPDVKRKLNEMFFRGVDLRYSTDAAVRVATRLEEDEETYLR